MQSREQGQSSSPDSPYPNEATQEDIAAISANRRRRMSLPASISQAMISEANGLEQKGLEGDWEAYKRIPNAFLNVEAILRQGDPQQLPHEDYRWEDKDTSSTIDDFLFEPEELEAKREESLTAEGVEWYLNELQLVEILAKRSPLEFVDQVAIQEIQELERKQREERSLIDAMLKSAKRVGQQKGHRTQVPNDDLLTENQEVSSPRIEALKASRYRFHNLRAAAIKAGL